MHKFVPMPKAMKIPDAKAAVDKELETLQKNTGMAADESQKQKDVIDEARKESKTVHFASLMDICHLKNSELEPTFQKYKGRVVLRRDIVKDASGSYAVFGSSASQMTAAKVMDVIARLLGCAGQAADAVSPYTQVKMENAPSLLKIPKSTFLDSSTKTQMTELMVQHGRPSRSSRAKCVRSSSGRTIMGKAIRDSSIGARLGKSSELGMFLRSPTKRTILIRVCGRRKTCWEETKH